MKLSARNQLKGKVKSVKHGSIMAEVLIELPDGQEMVATITLGSVSHLDIKAGDDVYAIIKSTEVMVGKDG